MGLGAVKEIGIQTSIKQAKLQISTYLVTTNFFEWNFGNHLLRNDVFFLHLKSGNLKR